MHFEVLRQSVAKIEVQDIAVLLGELPEREQTLFFRILPRQTATDVFAYLSQTAKEELLKTLSDEDALDMVRHLDADDRAAFLNELPAEVFQVLIHRWPREKLSEVPFLLGYPTESVGRLMQPKCISIAVAILTG